MCDSQVPLAPETAAAIKLENIPGLADDHPEGLPGSTAPASSPGNVSTDVRQQGPGASTFHAMLAGRKGAPAAFPIPLSHRQVCHRQQMSPATPRHIDWFLPNIALCTLLGKDLVHVDAAT